MKHHENGNVVSLIITFTSCKHNYNQNPFSIVWNRQPKACPVQSFLDYAVTLYHVTVFALLAFLLLHNPTFPDDCILRRVQ